MRPIQVFGFENFAATGAIVERLETLSDAGTIRVVGARMLHKRGDDDLVAADHGGAGS